jgi:hypothetical protein
MSTAGLYTLREVPEIVDVVVEGVEQVVVKVVEGSKRVIRAISIGIMIIATTAMSRVGYSFLRVVYERTPRLTIFRKAEKRSFDVFVFKYRGRLKGGVKSDEEKANGLPMVPHALPSANLSANEVLRMPVMEEDREAIINRVDPRLLQIGDACSYVYSRGTRQGQWKTVTLKAKVEEAGYKNTLFLCYEVDLKTGVVSHPKVRPSLSTNVRYPMNEKRAKGYVEPASQLWWSTQKEATSVTDQQSWCRYANPELQCLPPSKTSWSDESTVGSAKIALRLPLDNWKASDEWKAEKRKDRATEMLQITDGKPTEPAVRFYTAEGVLPVVGHEIEEMKKSLFGVQYNLDHTTCFMKMNRKLGDGVRGKLILDSKNFYQSSCARQAPHVKEFFDSGGEVRILNRRGRALRACMLRL